MITVHEIEYGLNLLPKGSRRTQLKRSINALMSRYATYIVPVNHEEAQAAATLRAMEKNGQVISFG